jgi:hypothetical protein
MCSGVVLSQLGGDDELILHEENNLTPAVVMETERGWRFALSVTTTGRDPNFTLQVQISSGAVTVETVPGGIKYGH